MNSTFAVPLLILALFALSAIYADASARARRRADSTPRTYMQIVDGVAVEKEW